MTNPVRPPEWHDYYENVTALARWLVEEGGMDDIENLLDYIERPWKWTPEWEIFQASKKTPPPHGLNLVEDERLPKDVAVVTSQENLDAVIIKFDPKKTRVVKLRG